MGGIGTGMFFALRGTPTSAATRAAPGGSSTCATTASSTSSPTTGVLLDALGRMRRRPGASPRHPDGQGGRGRSGQAPRARDGRRRGSTRDSSSGSRGQADASSPSASSTPTAPAAISRQATPRPPRFMQARSTGARAWLRVGSIIALAAPEVPLDERYCLLRLATEHKGLRVAGFASAEMPMAAEMGICRSWTSSRSTRTRRARSAARGRASPRIPGPFLEASRRSSPLHSPHVG